MDAADIGWAVLKAVEFSPGFGVKSPFRAYRAVPTSALDEVLSEGVVPRPMLSWYKRPEGWKGDEAIFTFRQKPNSRAAIMRNWDAHGYDPANDPLLQARFFADAFNPETPMSIVGSRVTPPGRSWIDPDYAPQFGFRAMMSAKPIAPQHLEEVIPVLDDGREIRYRGESRTPTAIEEDMEALFPKRRSPHPTNNNPPPRVIAPWDDDDDDFFD